MFMSFFNPDSVTIVRKPSNEEMVFDDFGNEISLEISIEANALIKYGRNNTTVSADNLKLSSYDAELFFPTGTIIEKDDEFVLSGERFKIDSSPEYRSNGIKGSFISPPVVVKIVRSEYIG